MLSSSSYCGAFSSYIFSCVRTWKSIGFHLDPWLLSSTYVVPWFIDKFRLSWSRGGGKCCLKEKATARGTRPQLVVKIRHQERIVFLGEYPIVFNGKKKALGELIEGVAEEEVVVALLLLQAAAMLLFHSDLFIFTIR